jgi:hypothetical protein
MVRKLMGLGLLAVSVPVGAAEHGAQIVDQAWVKAMKANDLVGASSDGRSLTPAAARPTPRREGAGWSWR